MRFLRLSLLLAASLTLVGCGTVSRMFQAGGRALHLNGESTKSPEDFRLESREVRASLADGARLESNPQPTRPELAQR